jgi:hypothetical protein
MSQDHVPSGRILVGPAGWSYQDWEGQVYPTPKPQGCADVLCHGAPLHRDVCSPLNHSTLRHSQGCLPKAPTH